MILDHGLEFARGAGEDGDALGREADELAWRGAVGIGKDLGILKDEALFKIVGGGHAATLGEEVADVGLDGLVVAEGNAECLAEGLDGAVIGSGAEAAGEENEIGSLEGLLDGGDHIGGIIADLGGPAEGDALFGEEAAEPCEVGILAETDKEFIADGD